MLVSHLGEIGADGSFIIAVAAHREVDLFKDALPIPFHDQLGTTPQSVRHTTRASSTPRNEVQVRELGVSDVVWNWLIEMYGRRTELHVVSCMLSL